LGSAWFALLLETQHVMHPTEHLLVATATGSVDMPGVHYFHAVAAAAAGEDQNQQPTADHSSREAAAHNTPTAPTQ
jgi:hypothetical protein